MVRTIRGLGLGFGCLQVLNPFQGNVAGLKFITWDVYYVIRNTIELAKEELEEKNFENLVWFYREELEDVSNGNRASKVFPKGLRRRLLDMGVLVYRKGRHNMKYLLSRAAMEMLNRMTVSTMTGY